MIVIAWIQMPLSLLLFWRIPSISLNDFTEIEMIMKKNTHTSVGTAAAHGGSTETSVGSDLCIDLRILFSNKLVVFIIFATSTCVTVWGMYYGSFGIWLQQLFNLDAESLGLSVTICEAVAESIALCGIPILSRCIGNSWLCIIGGSCEIIS